MDSGRPRGNGIFILTRQSKSLALFKTKMSLVFTNRVEEARSNGREDIHICKVHTNDNVADPLTKALSQQKHESHTSSISIRYMNDWL